MIGQSTPSPSPEGQPIIDVSGGAALWLIVGVSVALVLAWAVPVFLETRRAYRAFRRTQFPLIQDLIKAAREDKITLTEDETKDLVTASTQRFGATTGLIRALMAFAIISVIGVALIALLVSGASDASDLRKTIITALLSILATMVGFYFGSRTAEEGKAEGKRAEEEARKTATGQTNGKAEQ